MAYKKGKGESMKNIKDSYEYNDGLLTILCNEPTSERMAFYERLLGSLEHNCCADPIADIKEIKVKNVSGLGLVDLHLEIFENLEKLTFGKGVDEVPGGLFDLSYMDDGDGAAFPNLREIDFGNAYVYYQV